MKSKATYEIAAALGLSALAFKFWPRTAQPSDVVPVGSTVILPGGQTQVTTVATNVSALQLLGATKYTTPGWMGYAYTIPSLTLPSVTS